MDSTEGENFRKAEPLGDRIKQKNLADATWAAELTDLSDHLFEARNDYLDMVGREPEEFRSLVCAAMAARQSIERRATKTKEP